MFALSYFALSLSLSLSLSLALALSHESYGVNDQLLMQATGEVNALLNSSGSVKKGLKERAANRPDAAR